MEAINLELTRPQIRFLNIKQPFRALIGGFGSSKTYTICIAQILHFFEFPGLKQAYYAPTYPLIRDIFYPTIAEVAEMFGVVVKVRSSDKEVDFFHDGVCIGTTICRTMDNPATIVGYKVARSAVDEIDILPMTKAEDAWIKIIARQRLKYAKHNGVDFATTPEGFSFAYNLFEKLTLRGQKQSPELYAFTRASTYENKRFLPDDYISNLESTYPQELCQAYLGGFFVNLVGEKVYTAFERHKHSSSEVIRDGETLYIGQDFNVNHMASVFFVKRDEEYHAVYEFTDLRDTFDLIDTIKDKFANHRIVMYPDASGKAQKTSASRSDIQLLKDAGFIVRNPRANPLQRDRVTAVNRAFLNDKVKINGDLAPTVVECLEKQIYNKASEPDKTQGYDHTNDALGYFINYEMPVKRGGIIHYG